MSKSQTTAEEELKTGPILNSLPRHNPSDDHFDINGFRSYLEIKGAQREEHHKFVHCLGAGSLIIFSECTDF